MNKIFTLLLVGALTAGAVTANAESQIFKKKKKKAKAETEQPAAKDSTKSSMTEYKKLLKGAKTIDGMFKVHIVKDKYYFEIPKDLMGRDFMIASRVSSTSNNKDIAAGQMPRNPVLVTFSADKKKIYMHKKMVRNLCDTTSNMYAAFQRNFSDPIWEAYKIESLSICHRYEFAFHNGCTRIQPVSFGKYNGCIDEEKSTEGKSCFFQIDYSGNEVFSAEYKHQDADELYC